MNTKILLINGPNLQLLGIRSPEIYGCATLSQLEAEIQTFASTLSVELICFQSNHEGDIVSAIGETLEKQIQGIIINPGAYTHTSIAIRDAIEAVSLPTVEVHLSNVYAREEFRHHSLIAPVCIGQIAGCGIRGYEYALRTLKEKIVSK